MRAAHDTQVSRQKGNERNQIQVPGTNQVNTADNLASDNTVSEKLDPSTCSKIVAAIVKNTEGLERTVAQLHRWNIHTPLTFHRLSKNCSTDIQIDTQNLFNEGAVTEDNPFEQGKFVIVIKNKVNICHLTLFYIPY